jgi:hypothetical protein
MAAGELIPLLLRLLALLLALIPPSLSVLFLKIRVSEVALVTVSGVQVPTVLAVMAAGKMIPLLLLARRLIPLLLLARRLIPLLLLARRLIPLLLLARRLLALLRLLLLLLLRHRGSLCFLLLLKVG